MSKVSMTTALTTITPAMAGQWLTMNTHNRFLRAAHVARLAGDMSAGLWRTTHQGIAFDSAGVLQDGQHRLAAIVKSGVTVTMLVSRHVSVQARQAIDVGQSRNVRDLILQPWCTAHVASVYRSASIGCGPGAFEGEQKVTRQQTALGVLANQAALEQLVAWEGGKHWVLSGPTVGPALRAYYVEDHNTIAEFLVALRSGDAPPNSGVRLLREWLIKRRATGSTAGGSGYATMVYSKATRALQSFLRGESLTRLYTTDDPLWPAPPNGMKR